MVSAQPAVKNVIPKWHQINSGHFRALFLMWHLFQANVLSGTPTACTSPPLTYTPVCESVCEEWFRNLPGNQSTDLYLLLHPTTAAPAAGGCGELRTDENRASLSQGDILYAGQNRWSKCGRSPKDIACSISILHSKWFNSEGGREESHISNCWLSLILQSLHLVWNALIQPQSCLQRGKKRIFENNSKCNSLCNCNYFLFHKLHHPGQENETGNRLGSNLNTCWQAIVLRLHLHPSKNVKLLYPLSLTWFHLTDFPSAGNHMSNYLSATWNNFWCSFGSKGSHEFIHQKRSEISVCCSASQWLA